MENCINQGRMVIHTRSTVAGTKTRRSNSNARPRPLPNCRCSAGVRWLLFFARMLISRNRPLARINSAQANVTRKLPDSVPMANHYMPGVRQKPQATPSITGACFGTRLSCLFWLQKRPGTRDMGRRSPKARGTTAPACCSRSKRPQSIKGQGLWATASRPTFTARLSSRPYTPHGPEKQEAVAKEKW